jgi:hypothetical protein
MPQILKLAPSLPDDFKVVIVREPRIISKDSVQPARQMWAGEIVESNDQANFPVKDEVIWFATGVFWICTVDETEYAIVPVMNTNVIGKIENIAPGQLN